MHCHEDNLFSKYSGSQHYSSDHAVHIISVLTLERAAQASFLTKYKEKERYISTSRGR
jgi:hypothetical protein